MKQTAYLVLQNGKVFTGKRFGADGDVTGEIVFTTAMTGYLETLTDPSYCGQIVVQTFPLIGNYGVIPSDFESKKPNLKAYIVYDYCQDPSNFRSQGCLDNFLKEQNIPGLYSIDTRALTKIIREHGVMNGMITSSVETAKAKLAEIEKYTVKDPVAHVSCKKAYTEKCENPSRRVILWDFGAKANIRRELLSRGCEVITVPYSTTCKEIMQYKPDGIMLSNGPGDPAENTEIIKQLALLNKHNIPTFGICLGHQLLALSTGAKTHKLKYGHRGANQPVKCIKDDKVFITSQNHGYAVSADTLGKGAKVSFVNANDGTCEGIDYTDMPAFSVQFHPEASAGPLDTAFLFDRFIKLMEGDK